MRKLALRLINWYQTKVSPETMKKCRFTPSCSEYARQCYTEFNFFKASFLTLKRLLKCNPLFRMKYDPIPEKKHKCKSSSDGDGSI